MSRRFIRSYPLCVATALSEKSNGLLALGLPEIDDCFPGFQRGKLAVLFGHSTCKTLSFLLSVRCQLPIKKEGLNCRAVYVDCGNTFDPYSVSAIAQKYSLEPKRALENISVSRAFTAYQLTPLIFEKLEEALKRYRSKLVIISDVTRLFQDRDVPEDQSRETFIKMAHHLSELALTRRAIIVATCLHQSHSSRSLFLKSVLFGRASTVIRLRASRGALKFILEYHPSLTPFAVDFYSNAVTMDRFLED
ncbi:MAG: hypothetical protein JSV85_04640 [Candidatus Bathyarchaeota archaeon]|nr:MAG: hypothetical protein JSV85_04640 [Candidatus Bathyarchaeota archaeon]